MTAMPPLRDILNNTPGNAVDVEFNFNTLEAHVAQELINRDGSVSMTGPLSLAGPPTAPQHAVTKGYMDSAAIPVGVMWEFAGATAPTGWELCDGTGRSKSDPKYTPLFNVIGYAFGGSGDSFLLPDMRGRMAIGKGAAHSPTLGGIGGRTDAVVPNHTHDISHNHDSFSTASNLLRDAVTGLAVDGSHQHSVNASTGAAIPGTHRHGIPTNRYVMSQATGTGGNVGIAFQPSASPSSSQDPFLDDGNHTHNINVNTDPGQGQHTHTIDIPPLTGINSGAASGGTDPTNQNLPPFVALNFIIRIG